jgi:negative regulator of sigma E activity
LRFLYWKNPRLLGEETVRSRRAWKIEIPAPRSSSQYGAVRVWIDRESAALLRIEGYDKSGVLAKRFEVVSAQKIDGQWMLKQMRVERIDPTTHKTTGITYLEVLGRHEPSKPEPK